MGGTTASHGPNDETELGQRVYQLGKTTGNGFKGAGKSPSRRKTALRDGHTALQGNTSGPYHSTILMGVPTTIIGCPGVQP